MDIVNDERDNAADRPDEAARGPDEANGATGAGAATGESGAEAAPAIAWQRRKEIGAFWAYWRTVLRVIAFRGRIDPDLAAPLDLREAKRFRRRTVLHAAGSALVLYLTVLWVEYGDFDLHDYARLADRWAWVLGLGVAIPMVAFLLLHALTDAVAWFFTSRRLDEDRQDTALAVAYYTCAPLAISAVFSPPLYWLGLAVFTMDAPLFRDVGVAQAGEFVAWLNTAALASWYLLVLTALHATLGRSRRRTGLAAVLLPALWFILPAALLSIPFGVVMWLMMYGSLVV